MGKCDSCGSDAAPIAGVQCATCGGPFKIQEKNVHGEWFARDDSANDSWHIIGPNGYLVAICWDTAEADAVVTAKTLAHRANVHEPMLKALKGLMKERTLLGIDWSKSRAYHKGHAAIAKAEGKVI